MKIKTIEEIHKILKQKAIDTASAKVDFNSKMTENVVQLFGNIMQLPKRKMNTNDYLTIGINILHC